jgi:hypothetical protein
VERHLLSRLRAVSRADPQLKRVGALLLFFVDELAHALERASEPVTELLDARIDLL